MCFECLCSEPLASGVDAAVARGESVARDDVDGNIELSNCVGPKVPESTKNIVLIWYL